VSSYLGRMLSGVACACLLAACATQPAPGEVMKHLEQAERAYDLQNWSVAEDGYREMTRLVPQDAYAFFRLGNTLARQKRLEEAAVAYQEALIRDASFSKAYNNLGMIRLFQAEAAFDASVNKGSGGAAPANSARMLKEIRRITNIPVQEIESPMGKRSTGSVSARKSKNN